MSVFFIFLKGIVDAQELFQSKIIWDKAPHCAFTSLLKYNNSLFLAFREGKSHVDRNGGDDGIIRILKSNDGENWNSIDEICIDGYDLRDPQLSVSPLGILTLNFVAATYADGHPTSYNTYFSEMKSERFGKPEMIRTPLQNNWIWRIHWYKGKAYGFNYIDTYDLLSSDDGKVFSMIRSFGLPGKSTETDFIYDDRDFVIVDNRDNTTGLIGKGSIETGKIKWFDSKIQFVGPILFRVNPNTILFLASVYVTPRKLEQRIYQLKGTSLHHVASLPSSADCGYMGAAIYKKRLYISYYSTVEPGKVAIYISKIPLDFFSN